MSQRSLKRNIRTLGHERERLTDLRRAYDTVIADLKLRYEDLYGRHVVIHGVVGTRACIDAEIEIVDAEQVERFRNIRNNRSAP
jgi:hypothetical protein